MTLIGVPSGGTPVVAREQLTRIHENSTRMVGLTLANRSWWDFGMAGVGMPFSIDWNISKDRTVDPHDFFVMNYRSIFLGGS
jgi:hypothetical protein